MKKYILRTLCILLASVIIITGAFLIYTADYYHAEDSAAVVMSDGSGIVADDIGIVLKPSIPNGIGIVFYPGAKVEYTAYLPLMQKLQQRGFLCVLVKMPFNLAFFGKNTAAGVFNKYPEISDWYMAGHSLGGAMAGAFASENQENVDGLILLGSYIYGDIPTDKALVLYGSEDTVLNRSKLTGGADEYEIKGANHAQFGNYGVQKGDGTAEISADMQQSIAADKIEEFISAISGVG